MKKWHGKLAAGKALFNNEIIIIIGKIVDVRCCNHVLFRFRTMYAEVVTFVAGSLEAGGLPGSLEIPEVLK